MEQISLYFGTPISKSIIKSDLEEYVMDMSKSDEGVQISNRGGWQSKPFFKPEKEFELLCAEIEEKIKGLENKAKKTGMPYGILKKVYDRGMAAWKGGHRPGTTQQQWAFARVNSFVTKSSGTWGGADKDLAKQVRARG